MKQKVSWIVGLLATTLNSVTFAGVRVIDYSMKQIKDAQQEKFQKVQMSDAVFKKNTVNTNWDVSGMDDILVQEGQRRILVFSMDHTVKLLDLEKQNTEIIASLDVMPAGAVQVPGSPDDIIFCATRGKERSYPDYPAIGLYHLNVKTRELNFIFSHVPRLANRTKFGFVPDVSERLTLNQSKMNNKNSRSIQHCNDVAISADGQRVYITEPFDTVGSTDGGADSQEEAFLLRKNGMIWKLDLTTHDVSLVAQNLTFPDGILVKKKSAKDVDDSLIISELSQYRLLTLDFSSSQAKVTTLIDGLPGSPDGLSFDQHGNIWVALVKERTKILSLANRFPFLKKFLLALPEFVKPVPKGTGLLKLSPQGVPLIYVMHDGSVMTDIAAVSPTSEGVLLSTYNPEIQGMYYFTPSNQASVLP